MAEDVEPDGLDLRRQTQHAVEHIVDDVGHGLIAQVEQFGMVHAAHKYRKDRPTLWRTPREARGGKEDAQHRLGFGRGDKPTEGRKVPPRGVVQTDRSLHDRGVGQGGDGLHRFDIGKRQKFGQGIGRTGGHHVLRGDRGRSAGVLKVDAPQAPGRGGRCQAGVFGLEHYAVAPHTVGQGFDQALHPALGSKHLFGCPALALRLGLARLFQRTADETPISLFQGVEPR